MSRVLAILNKDNWIQDNWATDADGLVVDSGSEDAVKFCIAGALNRAYPDMTEWTRARRNLAAIQPSLTAWNDRPGRTWEEVESLIKEAGV